MVALVEARCRCGKLLGRNLEGRIEIVCPRCRRFNTLDSRQGRGGGLTPDIRCVTMQSAKQEVG